MPQSHNGFEEPDDIRDGSREDAADFLGLTIDDTFEDAEQREQDLALDLHPDTGGTTGLFQALQKAVDIFDETNPGEIGTRAYKEAKRQSQDTGEDFGSAYADARKRQRGRDRGADSDTKSKARRQAERAASAAGPGAYASGVGQEDWDTLVNAVKEKLRQRSGPTPYVDEYGLETVAEVMATLIINGAADLGDVEKMLGDDDIFGATTEDATGGTYTTGGRGGGMYGSGGGSGWASGGSRDHAWSPEQAREKERRRRESDNEDSSDDG